MEGQDASYYSERSGAIPTGTGQEFTLEPLEVRRVKRAYMPGHLVSQLRRRQVIPSLRNEEDRKEFVFHLYCLLFFQFIFLLIAIQIFKSTFYVYNYMKSTPMVWQISGSAALFLILIVGCVKKIRRHHIFNMVLASVWLSLLSVCLSSLVIFYDLRVVDHCIAVESSILVYVMILAKFSPCDVMGCSMIFCVVLTLLTAFGLVTCLTWLLMRFSIEELLIGGASVALLTLYLMFCTQGMMEGGELGPDDIVEGNAVLYSGPCLLLNKALKRLLRSLPKYSQQHSSNP